MKRLPYLKQMNEAKGEQRKVNISQIKAGDTIIHNGVETTVTQKDIKRDEFMGTTLFGDSYNLGNKPVILVEK